jgi:endoglucanase
MGLGPRGAGTCLLAVLMLLAFGVTSAAAAHPAALTVVGNQVDAGGNPVQLRGVNRPYFTQCNYNGYTDGPVDQGSITTMLSWDINVVRVPVNESCWLGLAGQPSDGQSATAYQQSVEDYVNLLGQNGLYVILSLGETAPPGYAAGGIDTLPDEANAPTFWQQATAAFKSDRWVIFDLVNEVAISQYDTTMSETTIWNCWLNGCSNVPSVADPTAPPFTSAGMQQLVNTVRASDATTPLLIGSPDYDFDKSLFASYPLSDPDHQLLYDVHLYDFADFEIDSSDDSSPSAEAGAVQAADSYLSATIVPIAQTAPMVIGELGQQDCDDTGTGTAPFVTGVLGDVDELDASDGVMLSVLGWAWDANDDNGTEVQSGDSCPTGDDGSGGPLMIRDYDGTPTVMGQVFKSWFAERAAGGASAPSGTPTTKGGSAPSTPGKPSRAVTTAKASVRCKLRRGSCRIQLRLLLGRQLLGSRTVTVRAGHKTTVTVALNVAGRRLLGKRGSLSCRLQVREASGRKSRVIAARTVRFVS